jgi:NAD(P)-dependent dehydrogenase (short-subunit alcohol dehydrogenase family)
MDLKLAGRVALVTGGGRDVGREISLALAGEGAAVAVNYNGSQAAAEKVVADIKAKGGKAVACKCDVADYAAVKAMVEKIVADFGRLDIIVNNAGYTPRQRFLDSKPSDWTKQIDIGLYGVLNTTHAALPHMIRNGCGRIVNLAGDSARVGESGLAVTAASRGGVIAFSKSIAKEHGRDGVTANVLALGLIETSHTDPAWMAANREKITRLYPTRRLGTPSDIAPLVTLLASDAAAWISGQVVSISGGFSMSG